MESLLKKYFVNQTEGKKEEKRTSRKYSKMMGTNLIILSINGLDILIERERLIGLDKKMQDPTNCMLLETHIKYKDPYML